MFMRVKFQQRLSVFALTIIFFLHQSQLTIPMQDSQDLKFVNVICNRITHQGNIIIALCLRQQCQLSSACCFKCILEHQNCLSSIKYFEELPQMIQPYQKIQQDLEQVVQKIIQMMKEFISLIKHTLLPTQRYIDCPNLTNLNGIGLFLKQEIQIDIRNSIEKIEKDVRIVFEDCKQKINQMYFNLESQNQKQQYVKSAIQWADEGIQLKNVNKFQEAIECYEQAISLDPKFKEAYYNKGVALYKLKRYQKSIRCLQQALHIDPNYTQVMNYLQMVKQAFNKEFQDQ